MKPIKIRRTIEIAAPGKKIWPFLVEPQKILKWCTPIRELRNSGGQEGGVGTLFYFEEKACGRIMKLNFTVTEWVVNECIAFTMTSGNLVKGYTQKYTLEPAGNGSLCTCSEDVKLPYGILGRIAGLVRRSKSESLLERMLANLKCAVEA